ncbi:class II aldolase/adducin family protein [Blastococcus sp. CT_GayMR19]|uniref:class II aldolase/adducin family protein n=1 Tax=Blastococcus sp. CT_GayMR19 TaxID=2559608 RepID=UPI00107379BB|nr:class II aldolase/adducin family protein [Blastococcus sp. CT_GayMR19]TFV74921.1 class II aldolase/adducin family protein [Blastococcus sp. CT_GayMR19]
MTEDLRGLVSLGCRVLGDAGQGDLIWGHVSARDPEGRGVWMKASGLGFEEVRPADVILVSWDGEVLEGEGRRHAEYPIHTEAMRRRTDVGSVIHTHSPAAVALGSLGVPLRPISHEANLFVPDDLARFTATTDLILTAALGEQVAETLADRNACLLVNHGIVVAAADVATATITAYLLDRACQMQLTAMAAGELASWSSPEESLSKREHCYSDAMLRGAWDYLVRRLDRH